MCAKLLGFWKPAFTCGATGREHTKGAAPPRQRQSWGLAGAVPGAGISGGDPLAHTLIPRRQPTGALLIHTHAAPSLGVASVDAHTLQNLSHTHRHIFHRQPALSRDHSQSSLGESEGTPAHADTRIRGTRTSAHSPPAELMAGGRVTDNPDFHQQAEPRGRFSPKTEHSRETRRRPPILPLCAMRADTSWHTDVCP